MATNMDETTVRQIERAVERGFSMNVEEGRYIDVSRIPLICQSIIGIDKKLEEMRNNLVTQDQFWPIRTLVYGVVGLMLSGMVVAIIALVVNT